MWTMQGKMVGGSNSIRMFRKTLFHGQLVPIRPVSAVFSANYAYQTTGLRGQVGLTCGQDDPLSSLQLQTSWTGGILTGKMAFQRAKVVPSMLIFADGKPSW